MVPPIRPLAVRSEGCRKKQGLGDSQIFWSSECVCVLYRIFIELKESCALVLLVSRLCIFAGNARVRTCLTRHVCGFLSRANDFVRARAEPFGAEITRRMPPGAREAEQTHRGEGCRLAPVAYSGERAWVPGGLVPGRQSRWLGFCIRKFQARVCFPYTFRKTAVCCT